MNVKIKKRNRRKIAIFLSMLILSMGVMTSNYTISSAESIPVTTFDYTENFTTRSISEPVTLQLDCDTVSFSAECSGEDIDNITCYIVDVTHNNLYDYSFAFDADGTVYTVFCDFPQGRYYIYFVGDGDITKTSASVVFSKIV